MRDLFSEKYFHSPRRVKTFSTKTFYTLHEESKRSSLKRYLASSRTK